MVAPDGALLLPALPETIAAGIRGIQGLAGEVGHVFQSLPMLDNVLHVAEEQVEHLLDALRVFARRRHPD